jgi:hypothetical protein
MNIPDLATLAASEVPHDVHTMSPAWHVRFQLMQLLQGTQQVRQLLSLRYDLRLTLSEMAEVGGTSETHVLACWITVYDELSRLCGMEVPVPDLEVRFNPWRGFLSIETEWGKTVTDCKKLVAEMIASSARTQKRMEDLGLW